MNSLSSLPPPAFADLAMRAPVVPATTAPEQARMSGFPALDDTLGAAAPLHVGPAGGLASIDDIERSFMAALCSPNPA